MATLTWTASWGFDLRKIDLSNLNYGYSYTRAPTLFSANYDSAGYSRDEFRGYGFTYDANGIPAGGVVTNYASFVYGKKTAFIDGASVAVSMLVGAASTYSTWDDLNVYKYILSGNDWITGGVAGDRLEGFAGNDILYGKGGADRLYGGAGADRFTFKSTKESTVASSGRDTIFDFSASQKDKIDLRTIDANTKVASNQAFTFIGSKAFSKKAGELSYQKVSSGSIVKGDVNGDGAADFSIFLKGVYKVDKGYFLL